MNKLPFYFIYSALAIVVVLGQCKKDTIQPLPITADTLAWKQVETDAAIVEIVALKNAQVKYSTVQNWYPGDKNGKGGIYNFVTKRGICKGENSKISWTQVETGSAITWKYPSCILLGDNSSAEFYSVAVTNHHQQADTGYGGIGPLPVCHDPPLF